MTTIVSVLMGILFVLIGMMVGLVLFTVVGMLISYHNLPRWIERVYEAVSNVIGFSIEVR